MSEQMHRIAFSTILGLAALLVPHVGAAQIAPLPPAPQPRTQKVVGVSAQMPTELTSEGACTATGNSATPSDANGAQIAAHQACQNLLIPKQPVPLLQTPGAFFVGYAWGSKSKQFVYGPQVGIGAAVLFPLRRPSLRYVMAPADGTVGNARKWTFALPSDMAFAADLAVSLNVNLAAFTFPNATGAASPPESSEVDDGKTQQTFNAGVYVAPQFGWEWWDGSAKRVMFSLGIMAGYIDTEATGSAFVLGVQPGILAQF